MQWNEIQKDWKACASKFQTKWPKLTEADIKAVAGQRDALVERLGKHYKVEKAKLRTEVEDFVKTLKPVKS